MVIGVWCEMVWCRKFRGLVHSNYFLVRTTGGGATEPRRVRRTERISENPGSHTRRIRHDRNTRSALSYYLFKDVDVRAKALYAARRVCGAIATLANLTVLRQSHSSTR